jgi:hypothetical protein
MKTFAAFLIALHAAIHALGFVKGVSPEILPDLPLTMGKVAALIWLGTALCLIAASLLFYFNYPGWYFWMLAGGILSTGLVLSAWSEAKYGMLVNLLVLAIALAGFTTARFEGKFLHQAASQKLAQPDAGSDLLTEKDIAPLPPLVQSYLRYVGVLGKPKVYSAYIVFEGKMRAKGKDYFPFISKQYNFLQHPTRLFFMYGKLFGIQVPGYHAYAGQQASMDIRVGGILSVVKHTNLFQAETVTFFNDMCFLAPAMLTDRRITWKTLDEHSVEGTFHNQGTAVTAILYFDPIGRLTNFVSFDRTAVDVMQQLPWSTPILSYQTLNGLQLPETAEMIWHYPDGDFSYGTLHLKEVQYNIAPKLPDTHTASLLSKKQTGIGMAKMKQ